MGRSAISLIVIGFLGFVIGIALLPVVFDSTATALSGASAGSFSSATSVGELIPLVGVAAVMIVGIGLMGVGGLRMAKGGE